MTRPGLWRWLGRVDFEATARLQEGLRAEILAAPPGSAGDRAILLLCEHPPIVTLGSRGGEGDVLSPPERLAAAGIQVLRASRGGQATYHGPGQLVGYPVMRLQKGVLAHVEGMARAVIEVLGEYGIRAEWRRTCPGVWVGAAKICAFGVHVRRRVAIHGFALNVDPVLADFKHIIPCGAPSGEVTSMAALLGSAPSVHEVAARVAAAFSRVFALAWSPTE